MSEVVRYSQYDDASLRSLLQQLGLTLQLVDANEDIPGSFWGDEEAGLIQNTIYARADTPIHSLMHEACHYCLLYTSPSPRDLSTSRMPSSA